MYVQRTPSWLVYMILDSQSLPPVERHACSAGAIPISLSPNLPRTLCPIPVFYRGGGQTTLARRSFFFYCGSSVLPSLCTYTCRSSLSTGTGDVMFCRSFIVSIHTHILSSHFSLSLSGLARLFAQAPSLNHTHPPFLGALISVDTSG